MVPIWYPITIFYILSPIISTSQPVPRKHVLLIPEPTRARGTLLSANYTPIAIHNNTIPVSRRKKERKKEKKPWKRKKKNLYAYKVWRHRQLCIYLKKISCNHVFQRDGPRDGSPPPNLLKCSHPYPRVICKKFRQKQHKKLSILRSWFIFYAK
jgi:hypothetical protein